MVQLLAPHGASASGLHHVNGAPIMRGSSWMYRAWRPVAASRPRAPCLVVCAGSDSRATLPPCPQPERTASRGRAGIAPGVSSSSPTKRTVPSKTFPGFRRSAKRTVSNKVLPGIRRRNAAAIVRLEDAVRRPAAQGLLPLSLGVAKRSSQAQPAEVAKQACRTCVPPPLRPAVSCEW